MPGEPLVPAETAMTDANGSRDREDQWDEKRVFTTGEAARLCKVSQQTIIRCFDSGRLNGFRVPGSRFRRIPREELLRFMQENEIPTTALENSDKRVLIVDDDAEIVALVTDWLEGDGRFQVRSAANGYDAGLETERFKPHLIVLDYMLPDVNGDIVCERVSSNESLADTKVLFVSGVVEAREVERLIGAGAHGFMKKPFDLNELLGRIEDLLGLESVRGSQ